MLWQNSQDCAFDNYRDIVLGNSKVEQLAIDEEQDLAKPNAHSYQIFDDYYENWSNWWKLSTALLYYYSFVSKRGRSKGLFLVKFVISLKSAWCRYDPLTCL